MSEDSALEPEIISALEEEEKKIPASRVTEMIRAAKMKGYESARKDFERVGVNNEQNKGAFDESIISQKIQEALEASKKSQDDARFQEEINRTTDEFLSKLESGKSHYDDYDEVVGSFNPAAYPALVWLANNMDNTADIIYELAKNPQKLAAMTVIAERDAKGAQTALKKLSASIKSNQESAALEKRSPNAPLSKVQSSPVGSTTGEDFSVDDFRKMFR